MIRYKMVGFDYNSTPPQYRTWMVNNTPDYTGALYTGLKSGDQPLLDIMAYAVIDDAAEVDFNLPQPLSWNSTLKVLPTPIYNSQFAIFDGYSYLFGGTTDGYGIDGYGTTNKILRASLNNPTDWTVVDGYTLPSAVCLSQLAVVDGYTYLFGGSNVKASSNKILRASISNPLVWTDTGSTLPKRLHSSSLSISDGYLYLYGGVDTTDGYDASNVILRASTSNPLVWTNVGTLPIKLYASQAAIMDGYTFLLGGIMLGNIPINTIYSAPLSTPTTWSLTGLLPESSCYSQFFTVGSHGYLIGQTYSGATETRILRCNIGESVSSWVDTLKTINGQANHSQIGIIDDRLFLFGGNGSSVIFADNPLWKFKFTSTAALTYGNITRTQFAYTANLDKFELLGFPWWKTNY